MCEWGSITSEESSKSKDQGTRGMRVRGVEVDFNILFAFVFQHVLFQC